MILAHAEAERNIRNAVEQENNIKVIINKESLKGFLIFFGFILVL